MNLARPTARIGALRRADLDASICWELLDAAPDGILVIDEEGRIVLVNDELLTLFGYEREELLGNSVEMLVPEAHRETHAELRARFLAEPDRRPMDQHRVLQGRRRDASTFHVEISLSPINSASATASGLVVAIVRDVDDRVEAENRIRETEAQVELLADRERIARDLHDTVIQHLFATGMSLQAMGSRIEDPALARRLSEAVDALDDTIRSIRTVIFGLQAHAAWGRGLRGEILKIAHDEARALGFEPRVTFSGPVEQMPHDLAVHLVAVLREALSNVARHAEARRVEVELRADDDVVLMVIDDGIGVPEEIAHGSGLSNLTQRASSLGGALSLRSADHTGTIMEFRAPGYSDPG